MKNRLCSSHACGPAYPNSSLLPYAVKDGKDPSSGSSGSSMQTLVLTEGMVLGGGAFSRVSVATGELLFCITTSVLIC